MPREFLAVAFDSGGVATGPMTAAFLLPLAIANQGYTGSIMDAARAEGAGGGTVLHAKGTGMEGAVPFLGMELVSEKELVLIVARTTQKNRIMKSIMDHTDKRAGVIVFSLPVTDTAGLRLLEEDEPVNP